MCFLVIWSDCSEYDVLKSYLHVLNVYISLDCINCRASGVVILSSLKVEEMFKG